MTREEWIKAIREDYGSPMLAHRLETNCLTLGQAKYMVGFQDEPWLDEPEQGDLFERGADEKSGEQS